MFGVSYVGLTSNLYLREYCNHSPVLGSEPAYRFQSRERVSLTALVSEIEAVTLESGIPA